MCEMKVRCFRNHFMEGQDSNQHAAILLMRDTAQDRRLRLCVAPQSTYQAPRAFPRHLSRRPFGRVPFRVQHSCPPVPPDKQHALTASVCRVLKAGAAEASAHARASKPERPPHVPAFSTHFHASVTQFVSPSCVFRYTNAFVLGETSQSHQLPLFKLAKRNIFK